MAAISVSDCNVLIQGGEWKQIKVVTPSTADSNDTVDVSSLVADGYVDTLIGWDLTSGDTVTATYATGTGIITIDAAGGTTDHIYILTFHVRGAH
jgi:hypothetical protein